MDEKPDKAAPRRRWYQFSLGALLVGVALLGLPCAYVGWQAKVVRQRKEWLAAHRQEQPSDVMWIYRGTYITSNPAGKEPSGDSSQSPGFIRRWLGDAPSERIYAKSRDEFREAAELFPEAAIIEVGEVKWSD